MTRDFYRVFARVRVGCAEESDEYLVEHDSVGTYEVTEDSCACLALGKRCTLYGAKMLAGNADGVGAADADDADGSTLSGGYGADSVGRNHNLDCLRCKDTEEFFNFYFFEF